MSFFENGNGETVKAVAHGALGTLALACCGYNVVAFIKREDWHLLRNSFVYLGLTIYELAKVKHHCS